jgi:uncharacterized OB-fold protein
MLGKLICWFTKKHKRGHVVEIDEANKTKRTQCPRCGRVRVLKIKAAPQ